MRKFLGIFNEKYVKNGSFGPKLQPCEGELWAILFLKKSPSTFKNRLIGKKLPNLMVTLTGTMSSHLAHASSRMMANCIE
jgi:hypothetical protein